MPPPPSSLCADRSRSRALEAPPPAGRYPHLFGRGGAMTELAQAPREGATEQVAAINHWIGGKRVPGRSGRTGPVYNPATGEQTGAVDFASIEEVDAAVQAAKAAFPAWRAMSLSRRTELFFRIRKPVDEHREDIGRILTSEHGKVLSDAMGELARGL